MRPPAQIAPAALAARVRGLAGWRRRGLLALAGALAALALPPVHLLPVLLVSLPVLVWALDGAVTRRAAFGAGWWWAAGWYCVGLYWISYALLTDPEKFGWMIPFAVFGLSGLLAGFIGLATLAAHALAGRGRGVGRLPLLACAWTAAEWVRSWVLTGFPWNPIGSVWDAALPVAQAAAVAGVWGLCLITVLWAAAPALFADPAPRARRVGWALLVGLPLAVGGAGGLRLAAEPTTVVDGVRLRLVQPAVSQLTKWDERAREANLRQTILLSRETGFDRVTAVIWPETGAPFYLDLDPAHRALAAIAVPPGGLLLTGAPRITVAGTQIDQIWNSLFAIDGQGAVVARYDKAHLVPFGEYVPLRDVLPIAKITPGTLDFSAGPGPRTVALPGLPATGPMICYESIFPGRVVDPAGPRPGWLLTITNDGWFGISAGPYQHLAAARMRSIEEGLPLVRVANTGISAVYDALGREQARLGLGERGVLDVDLPQAAAPTPYARWGNWTVLVFGLLLGLLGWNTRRAC